jgi:predicted phosphodiesterase
MPTLLVISDLHFDSYPPDRGYERVFPEFINQLNAFLLANQIDGLLIAGDISKDLGDVIKLFNALKPLDIPKIYVPGNHELFLDIDMATFIPPDELTNPAMYYFFADGQMDMRIAGDGVYRLQDLRTIAEENHIFMLHEDPINISERLKTVIIGNIGWYNYEQPFNRQYIISPDIITKKRNVIDHEELFKRMDEGRNYTLQFFDPNTLFWNYLYMCVKYQIQLLKQMKFEHLLFLSHYIPLANCIPYRRGCDEFDHILKNEEAYKWFYARVTDLIQQNGLTIDAYIFGHRHSPCRGTHFICNPLVESSDGQSYCPRYSDDFTRYFQEGLFEIL